jgi:hypothetical protein
MREAEKNWAVSLEMNSSESPLERRDKINGLDVLKKWDERGRLCYVAFVGKDWLRIGK